MMIIMRMIMKIFLRLNLHHLQKKKSQVRGSNSVLMDMEYGYNVHGRIYLSQYYELRLLLVLFLIKHRECQIHINQI